MAFDLLPFLAEQSLLHCKHLNATYQSKFHHKLDGWHITNMHHLLYAIKLGLNCFYYHGSKNTKDVNNDWCNEKAGKIFTVNEARQWKRDKQDYYPFLDIGVECVDYGWCNHHLGFISRHLGEIKRPDLRHFTEEEFGKFDINDLEIISTRIAKMYRKLGVPSP